MSFVWQQQDSNPCPGHFHADMLPLLHLVFVPLSFLFFLFPKSRMCHRFNPKMGIYPTNLCTLLCLCMGGGFVLIRHGLPVISQSLELVLNAFTKDFTKGVSSKNSQGAI